MAEPASNPQLRLVGLDKTYPGGHRALRGVFLDVSDGEVVVIVGPSDCGKSTLLCTINDPEPINSGQILFDGNDLVAPGISWPEARRRIGMVFQSYELFPHLTVMGNLMLAPGLAAGESRADANAWALKLLERVGLADRADNYPRQLSSGQRQHITIVRALMTDPEILLLDKVTASLDSEMVREVLDVVLELTRTGMAMLIVTHEMGFTRAIADRIVFMDEGRIVEVDPSREFFADPASDRACKFLGIFSFEGAKLQACGGSSWRGRSRWAGLLGMPVGGGKAWPGNPFGSIGALQTTGA